VESQLVGAGGLEIRASVDLAYEKIVHTMFESLKQMAKLDGEGEDKGQLNYHVILIGVSFVLLRLIFCLPNGRKHASLRCRDCPVGDNIRGRLLEASRAYL
jgi:hypothetical protein